MNKIVLWLLIITNFLASDSFSFSNASLLSSFTIESVFFSNLMRLFRHGALILIFFCSMLCIQLLTFFISSSTLSILLFIYTTYSPNYVHSSFNSKLNNKINNEQKWVYGSISLFLSFLYNSPENIIHPV